MLTVCHAMQMKYHILLPSIYYGVSYFGCVLKYNHFFFFFFLKISYLLFLIPQKIELKQATGWTAELVESLASPLSPVRVKPWRLAFQRPGAVGRYSYTAGPVLAGDLSFFRGSATPPHLPSVFLATLLSFL